MDHIIIDSGLDIDIADFCKQATIQIQEFPDLGFFSEYLALTNNITAQLSQINTNTAKSKALSAALTQQIAAKQQYLLQFWAADLIRGFEMLQQVDSLEKMPKVIYKFLNNHHQHVYKIFEVLETDQEKYKDIVEQGFIATLKDQLDAPEAMLGVSSIKAKIKQLLNIQPRSGKPFPPQGISDLIKQIFNLSVEHKQRLLVLAESIKKLFVKIEELPETVSQKAIVAMENSIKELCALIMDSISILDGRAADSVAQHQFYKQLIESITILQNGEHAFAAQLAIDSFSGELEGQDGTAPPENVAGVQQALEAALNTKRPKLQQRKGAAAEQSPKSIFAPAPDDQQLTDAAASFKYVKERPDNTWQFTTEAADFTADDFELLSNTVADRVTKYNSPTQNQTAKPKASLTARSNPSLLDLSATQDPADLLSPNEQAARDLYKDTEVNNIEFDPDTHKVTKFEVRDKQADTIMFTAERKPATKQGRYEVVSTIDVPPTHKSLGLLTDFVKDQADHIENVQHRKIAPTVISDYEDDDNIESLESALSVFCALAITQKKCLIQFKDEGKNRLNKPDASDPGYFEVLQLLRHWSETPEDQQLLASLYVGSQLQSDQNAKLKQLITLTCNVVAQQRQAFEAELSKPKYSLKPYTRARDSFEQYRENNKAAIMANVREAVLKAEPAIVSAQRAIDPRRTLTRRTEE